MGRHELREQIFKLLFRVEFYPPDEMPEQVSLFVEDGENPLREKDADYVREKFQEIQERLPELDRLINENTEGWNTVRMGKFELTLLRIAVYESLYDEDIPVSVAINEAVELAKIYGQENAASFVNAILAKIAKLGG